MKIVAMVGSVRRESYNMKLVRFMQERYSTKVEIEILPINELPFFNEDEELNPPELVKVLREKIQESDGILFATPEYNASIPAVLKNAIDWFSRVEPVLVDKPAMIVGASMGVLGTVKAQLHLREILNARNVSTKTLPGNEVYVGSVHQKIDEYGNITDEATIQFIDVVMDQYVKWIEKTVEFNTSY
jgi:chromate reductase, NAD(P)H dehydrogenase (quinone)